MTFLVVFKISQESLNGFAPNSQGRRVWYLARTSQGQGQGHQGQKRHSSGLSAACVRFMFGETSLALVIIMLTPSLSSQGRKNYLRLVSENCSAWASDSPVWLLVLHMRRA